MNYDKPGSEHLDADTSGRRVQRMSLHEEVVDLVRTMILEGQLRPGRRIAEPDLCRRFNVSRTPLREALKVLASEGLVELQPNRGAQVTEIRPDETAEHFEVLEALEAKVGELVAARMTDAEIDEVRELQAELAKHHDAGRRAQYFALNQRVHAKLVAAARNKSLAATHLQYSRKIARVRYAANFSRLRWDQSLEEHVQIVEALIARDGERLAQLMREHLRRTAHSVLAAMEEADGEVQ
jgi:DNA-binding GntR family transcriptional regulator